MKELEYRVLPEVGFDLVALQNYVTTSLGDASLHVKLLKRSIDARGRQVMVNVKVAVGGSDEFLNLSNRWNKEILPSVEDRPQIIIVGAGPAGLFAAVKAIEMGFKPIVLERGKDVRARRRDLAAINKDHIVNPDSNYCFGEGGAGTYSDGKLYTRSTKRGDVNRVLEILVDFGAVEEILIDAHPHIGTNKLPKIIQAIRDCVIERGGQVLFEQRVTDFILEGAEIKGVKCGEQVYEGFGVVLATGHSARDIFELLDKKSIEIKPKPFALGVRVEHQQSLIDTIQYSCDGPRSAYLPAASYALKSQVLFEGVSQGVFSFCMCPGGFIVPSATAPGEIVVNGMSPSKRDSRFSNSGIVVTVGEEDFKPFADKGNLAGMYFQQAVEQKAFEMAGQTQAAPAQRLVDFTKNKVSTSLLETSYQPGLVSVDMRSVLPKKVAYVLQKGFVDFGKKAKGYYTNEAQVVGVESRTSSPVTIPRDRDTYEHTTVARLYPCGEGAGYAGGIVSAAIDGEKCVEMLVSQYGGKYM